MKIKKCSIDNWPVNWIFLNFYFFLFFCNLGKQGVCIKTIMFPFQDLNLSFDRNNIRAASAANFAYKLLQLFKLPRHSQKYFFGVDNSYDVIYYNRHWKQSDEEVHVLFISKIKMFKIKNKQITFVYKNKLMQGENTSIN